MVSKKRVNYIAKLYELQNNHEFISINENLLSSLKDIDEKLRKDLYKDSDCQKCYAELMKEYGEDNLFMKKLNESKPSKLNENMHYILSVFIKICRKRCEGQEFDDNYMKRIMKAMDDYTLFMQKEIELHRYHEDANILKLNFTYLDELQKEMDANRTMNPFLDNKISELALRISSILNGDEYDSDKIEVKPFTYRDEVLGANVMRKAEIKTNERLKEEVMYNINPRNYKNSPINRGDITDEQVDKKAEYVSIRRRRTNTDENRNLSIQERSEKINVNLLKINLAGTLQNLYKDTSENVEINENDTKEEDQIHDAVMNLKESISQSTQLVNPESVFQPTISNQQPFMKLEFPKQFSLTSKFIKEPQVIFLYHNLWTPSILEKNDVYEMKRMVKMILESKRIKMKEESSTDLSESSQMFTLSEPTYSRSPIPIDKKNEDTDTSTIEFVSDQEPPSFFKARMVKKCLLLIIFLMGGLICFTTFSKGFGAYTASFLTGASPSEELKGIPLLSSSASASMSIDSSVQPSLFQIMKMSPDPNEEVMGDSLVPLDNGRSGYKLVNLDVPFKFLPSLDEAPIFIPSSASSGKEVSTLVRPSDLTTPNPNAPSTAMTVQNEKKSFTPYKPFTLSTPSVLPDSLPVVDNNNTKESKALTTFVRLPEMGQSTNTNAPGNQVAIIPAKQAGEENPEPNNYLVPTSVDMEKPKQVIKVSESSNENEPSHERKQLSTFVTSVEEEVGLEEGMSSNPNAPSKALARYLTENDEFKEAVNQFYETQIYVNTEHPVVEIPWLHEIVTSPPDPLPLTLPKSYEKAFLQASKLKDREKVIDAYEETLTLVVSASEMSPSIPSIVVQIIREDTKNSSAIQDVVERLYEIDIAVRSVHDIGSYLVSSFPEPLQDNAHMHSVLSHEYSSCFALHVLVTHAHSFLKEDELKECVKISVEALDTKESGDLIQNMIKALDSTEQNSTLMQGIEEAYEEVHQDKNYNTEEFDLSSLIESLKAFFTNILMMTKNKKEDWILGSFFNEGSDGMTANILLNSIAKLVSLLSIPMMKHIIMQSYFRFLMKIIIKYIVLRYVKKRTEFESVFMSVFTKGFVSDSTLFLNMKVKKKTIFSRFPYGQTFMEKMTESIRRKESAFTFSSGSVFPYPPSTQKGEMFDAFASEAFQNLSFTLGMIPSPPSISM